VVGPDGVGKTTVAGALRSAADTPSFYFHFVPTSDRSAADDPGRSYGMKRDDGANMFLGWLRLVKSILRAYLGYLRFIRPRLREGELIIGDRWIYGYWGQPYTHRYRGPDWVTKLALRITPKPDLVALLTAPPQVIHDRKQELTVEAAAAELERWRRLPVSRLCEFPTLADPDSIARAIIREVDGG
jgi:thymidylate kinase